MECGIVTVDLHGRNTYQAKVTVDALLRRAGNTGESKLFCDDRGEYIIPDRYSMAPVFRAECEVQPEEEARR